MSIYLVCLAVGVHHRTFSQMLHFVVRLCTRLSFDASVLLFGYYIDAIKNTAGTIELLLSMDPEDIQ